MLIKLIEKKKAYILSVSLIIIVVLNLMLPITLKAESYNAYAALKFVIITCGDYQNHSYKITDGGYFTYSELWTIKGNLLQDFEDATLDETKFCQLTPNAQKKYLTDVLNIANSCIGLKEITFVENKITLNTIITEETVSEFIVSIQNMKGVDTAIISVAHPLLSDDIIANRIYEPFSGVIGTLLGLISIFLIAFLGISMSLDIAYFTIPAFNACCRGKGIQNSKQPTISGLISKAAKIAYQVPYENENQNKLGVYKSTIGIYLKYRWFGLLILVICFLYLLQGQIFSLTYRIIDLFKGFVEF